MDIHQKHESDLTRKEKWQLEKEKLAGMDWKHRFEYIREYYKLHITCIIIGICMIFAGFSWYDNLKHETILYVVPMNTLMDSESSAALENDVKKFLGDGDEYHDIVMDTSIAVGGDDIEMNMNSNVKITTVVAAGTVDVIIGTEDQVDTWIKQEVVLDLKDVLSEEMQQKCADKIVDGKKLDLTGNKMVKEKLMVFDEPVYLVILGVGDNQETSAKFVEYLME